MDQASDIFAGIEGQDRPLRLLQRALVSGRLGHAYLFEGIEGCGRRTTALRLFQALFCRDGSACGACPPCRRFLSGNHPDLQNLEPEGAFIKIEQVRQLQRELALKPHEAPRKGALILQADRLHPAAANALLKTLEEPPGDALMVLVTASPGAILPTIRSRCQAIPFSPLAGDVIRRLLEQRGIDSDRAAAAAPLSGGSMRRALELTEESDTVDGRQLAERVAALSLDDIPPLFSLAEELGRDRDTAIAALDQLLAAARSDMLLQQGCPELVAGIHPDALAPSTAGGGPERIDWIMEAMKALRRNANVRLTLDVLFMRLAE